MEEDEGGIFSKIPDRKSSLLLLKIKVKQIPGCTNKEYNECNIRAHSSEYQGLSQE